jgi:hypothetical protein
VTALVGEALALCAERLGTDATGVLARLAGSVGDAARTGARELASLPPHARRHRRAEILAAARSPTPQGLRGIHSTWIEAALEPLPVRARTAIASAGGDPSNPIDVWLARLATATLPPLPATADTPFEQLLALDAAALVTQLASIGADQLAFALGAPAATHPALAPAAARIAAPPRLGNLGSQRAAIGRARDVSLDRLPDALVIVAARALAPHLSPDPLARLQLTRRLPRPLGLLVEHELHAHASSPLQQAPAWPALLAR